MQHDISVPVGAMPDFMIFTFAPSIAPASVAEVGAPAVVPVQPRTRSLAGFVRVAGGFEALGLPKIGGQVAGAGGLLGRRWRAELTGSYRAPTTAYSPSDPSALTRNFGTTNSEMPFEPAGASGKRASTRWTMFSAMSCSP